MAERRALPLIPGELPHIEQARRRLGGRWAADVDAVLLGACARSGGDTGVVLYADTSNADLFVGSRTVRRVTRDRLEVLDDDALPAALRCIALDVARFAGVPEGRRARFRTETGAEAEGLVLEKCRFGALLGLDDDRVVAVGFGRLLRTLLPE